MEASQIENRKTKGYWNLSSPLFIKETEFAVQNFFAKETPGLDDIAGEFYQEFKEEIIPILQKFFQKNGRTWMFPPRYLFSSLLLNIVLRVLASAVRQEGI